MIQFLVAVYILATSSALISLKLGSADGAPLSFINGRLHLNITPFAVLGIFLYGFSFLLYMYLISKLDLGYIIPITTAFVYVIIFTASFLLFKESFSPTKLLAITLILGGIILLNIKK